MGRKVGQYLEAKFALIKVLGAKAGIIYYQNQRHRKETTEISQTNRS